MDDNVFVSLLDNLKKSILPSQEDSILIVEREIEILHIENLVFLGDYVDRGWMQFTIGYTNDSLNENTLLDKVIFLSNHLYCNM